MAQINVSGTVYWESGLPVDKSGRVKGAILKYQSGAVVGSVVADDDGDFTIAGIDDTEALSIILLHEGARPATVSKKAGEYGAPLDLMLDPIEGKVAVVFGVATLIVLTLVLAVLTNNYLSSHNESASDSSAWYSALIVAVTAVSTTDTEAGVDVLRRKLNAVNDARRAVDGSRTPMTPDVSANIDRLLAFDMESAGGNLQELATNAQGAAEALRNAEPRYFWTAWPWLMVEVWCWGLFGVLLTKIVRIGWYLRSSSYQARGTWMHLAHVVATPFLALVAVLVLSFLKLENESETVVNLSSPLFMVLTACLLSTNPWGLWDFILGRGDALRKQAESAS